MGAEGRPAERYRPVQRHYGIPERSFLSDGSKAKVIGEAELEKVFDPHVRMSLELQSAFGLRREEAIKFAPFRRPRSVDGHRGPCDNEGPLPGSHENDYPHRARARLFHRHRLVGVGGRPLPETAMTIVVVAEKPSVARDIARVLGARKKAEGHLEGNGYCVTWALGHLVHFAEDMVPQLPGILEKLDHPQAPLALERLRDGHKLGKAYVDQTKLTDHHAILPTGKAPPPSLPPTLRKIYDLIVDRFVGVFLPDQVVEETVMTLDIAGATFVAKGTRVLKAGWKWIEQGKAKEQGAAIEGGKGGDGRQALPTLEEGQTVHVKVMDVVEKETQPPKPYTDATLLAAMKHAGREIEDDALAEAMKQTGLGTPATRAEIIEKLIRTAYVQRERKQLRATEKGRALIALVAEPLRRHGSAEQTPISTAARTASEPLTCPKCGQGRIIEGKRGFGCNRFREGCDFVVWKEIGGKRLTEKQVHALIGKGKTGLLKGFKSKSGKKFDARLRLNPQWRVAFEFPQRNQGSIDSKKP